MIANAACRVWSSAIPWQVSGVGIYSHPHPQVQGASPQEHAGPQVQLQSQEQPWVLNVAVIVCSRFRCRLSIS